MDSRHESFKQGLLNHLIIAINTYIQNNTDSFIGDEYVQNNIAKICDQIYHFFGVTVDIYGVLSKHNLLSIDVVLFPTVSDPEASKILKESDFIKLIEHIEVITTSHQTDTPAQSVFKQIIKNALQEYQMTDGG